MEQFDKMKIYHYTVRTLSPVILSPRSSMAFYKGIDYDENDVGYNMIYPFYQYGEYDLYNPVKAKYYIPGSALKGAFTPVAAIPNDALSLFVDDIRIESKDSIEVISLNKSQYFDGPGNTIPKINAFFDGIVGIECLKAGVELTGEVRYTDDFNALIQNCSDKAKTRSQNDVNRLKKYISDIKQPYDYNTNVDSKAAYHNVINQIDAIKANIEGYIKQDNLVLLGGYKGVIRSLNLPNEDTKGAIFATKDNVPFGFAEIISIKEVK